MPTKPKATRRQPLVALKRTHHSVCEYPACTAPTTHVDYIVPSTKAATPTGTTCNPTAPHTPHADDTHRGWGSTPPHHGRRRGVVRFRNGARPQHVRSKGWGVTPSTTKTAAPRCAFVDACSESQPFFPTPEGTLRWAVLRCRAVRRFEGRGEAAIRLAGRFPRRRSSFVRPPGRLIGPTPSRWPNGTAWRRV